MVALQTVHGLQTLLVSGCSWSLAVQLGIKRPSSLRPPSTAIISCAVCHLFNIWTTFATSPTISNTDAVFSSLSRQRCLLSTWRHIPGCVVRQHCCNDKRVAITGIAYTASTFTCGESNHRALRPLHGPCAQLCCQYFRLKLSGRTFTICTPN